jgi:RNA polymerase sigma factor (sigma-70 family)
MTGPGKLAKSMRDSADVELLERWRAGDDEAGNTLVERHFHSVYRFFRRKMDDGADDLTQKTFLACVESRDRVRDATGFRAFLLGVARNVFLREMRTRGRHDRRLERAADEPIPTRTSPSQAAARREEQTLLLIALRTLPFDLQIVIELHYWEQLSTQEIGTVLDVPAGTIKWRLHRARERLAEAIEQIEAHPDVRRSTIDGLDHWARSLRRILDEA